MVPRVKAEKNIRQITREGVIVYPPEKTRWETGGRQRRTVNYV